VPNFREMSDAELAKLSDETLIDYVVRARAAGKLDAAIDATRVLASRYERMVLGFVHNRLGSKGPAVCDEVAEVIIFDAIKSAPGFEGEDVRSFRGWIFRIARNRIVDYHRKGRVDEIPLEFETREGETREREIVTGDPTKVIDRSSVINQALFELNDVHKLVVFLVRFRGLSHKKTATQINRHFGDALNDPMNEQNVNKINSRFGQRLDDLLDEAEDPPPHDHDDD
jgi:RNA polymerase sigma factor (sigma-70 family)